MKKISYIITASLVLLFGCKKTELDLFPYNQVETSQAFKTETDVNLALNGMYAGIRASGSYFVGGTWNSLADVLADNVLINPTGRQSQKTFFQWQYTADGTSGFLGGGYTIARRANAILENIGSLPDGTFKNNVKAEALAARAMTYFDMSRVFSKTYLNASAQDLTIPYITTTDPTIMPSGISVETFYGKVIDDLVLAESLINTNNGVGRFNKAAINGLLSRVYLYKGDYAKVITSATAALGTTPNLPNIATFPNIWKDATEQGVLFKIKNTTVDNLNAQGVNYYQALSAGIKSEYVIDYAFLPLFTATDVRKATYIQTSNYNGVSQNHIIKYNGRTGGAAGVVDGKVLRTAEVLLNRAEANYRLNTAAGATAALADINLLRANRYSNHVDLVLSGAPLLAEILLQRRLELAFEGDRFWDLKRLNLPVNRSAFGEKADGTGTAALFQTLAAGDYRFQLPFPSSEINFNSNLKQNPGY